MIYQIGGQAQPRRELGMSLFRLPFELTSIGNLDARLRLRTAAKALASRNPNIGTLT
jgi:hypothetical protein